MTTDAPGPCAPDPRVVRDLAIEAAEAVAPRLATVFHDRDTGAQRKGGAHDVVTDADLWAERSLRDHLLAALPSSAVVGEEYGTREGSTHQPGGAHQVRWHVDPIDGTINFATGVPFFCVSIGAEVQGRLVAGVVLDPLREECFATAGEVVECNGRPLQPSEVAEPLDAVLLTNFPYEAQPFGTSQAQRYGELLRGFRATRRLGSVALELAYVAAGRAEAAFAAGAHTWDVAAGAAMLQAAGGRFLTPSGDGPHAWTDGTRAFAAATGALELERTPLPAAVAALGGVDVA